MKKIAVIIRGQAREWHYAKHSIFETFSRFEDTFEVHYFFVTWDRSYTAINNYHLDNAKIVVGERKITQTEIETIRNDFEGRTLAALEVLDTQLIRSNIKERFFEEYELITFIRYAANLVKQNYEIDHHFQYDAVVDLRPDLFLLPHDDSDAIENAKNILGDLKNFVVYSASEFITLDREYKFEVDKFSFDFLFISDMMFISNSFTSNLLNSEFLFLLANAKKFKKGFSPHAILSDFMLEMKLINKPILVDIVKDHTIIRSPEYWETKIDPLEISSETFNAFDLSNIKFQKMKHEREKQ